MVELNKMYDNTLFVKPEKHYHQKLFCFKPSQLAQELCQEPEMKNNMIFPFVHFYIAND